ncbi:MAG: M24 family metallopeptidase [bacterium]|nr:M24 family metallopeptidase [bacterium]
MSQRLRKFQFSLEAPLLIKKKENLFYLTGRSFMNGYLLAKKDRVVFLGDGLEKVEGLHSDILKNVGMYIGRGKTLQVFGEFTYAEVKYLRRKNPKLKIQILVAHDPVDLQRQIKDEGELKSIAAAMRIGAKVFAAVRTKLKSRSWTEAQLATEIRRLGHRFGAEDVSFPPIVASGTNAAVPHHVPGSKKLRPNESIILDFGFKYHGYCSDFTRTIFLKSAPSLLAEAYNQVEKAYNAVLDKAKDGTKVRDLYFLAVRVLDEKKLGKYFIHNLGHGTGLEIHELPNLSPNSKDILRDGMVFSVEPGVYIPKYGGIRIEDLVYLKSGKLRKFVSVPTGLEENIIF